jgi:hypothetical protein
MIAMMCYNIKIGESMAEDMNKRRMDGALIIILMIAALIAALAVYLTHDKGSTAVVKVDGSVLYEFSLSEDVGLTVDGYMGGTNRIVIQDGKVSVTEADCPDALCVKTGSISRAGETIVCLPHRVVVEIKGTGSIDNDALDSVVR